MTKYFMKIDHPGGRRGWEIWLGPLGIIVTWPPQLPLAWHMRWWEFVA